MNAPAPKIAPKSTLWCYQWESQGISKSIRIHHQGTMNFMVILSDNSVQTKVQYMCPMWTLRMIPY